MINFKRFLPKNDITTTDLVFTAVVLGSMVTFGAGNILVGKQLLELKHERAEMEERRVHMCLNFKAHAIVYHFVDTDMIGYCADTIGGIPTITPLPKPEN